MTTTAGSSPQIDAYLAAVRESLGDLAEDERADLLAEVEASLVESAGESPIASLGPPEEFAAELRASAGLGEPAAAPAPSPGGIEALRTLAVALAGRPAVRSAMRVARELAPAWWLARGLLVVVALAGATGASWSVEHPWLPLLPDARATAFVAVLAVAASLALGLRTRGAGAALVIVMIAVDIVALLALYPLERQVRQEPAATVVSAPRVVPAVLPGLVDNGRRILNVYPYSRSGKLLHDVLLYDDTGRPITLGLGPDPLRRILVSRTGAIVANGFPIRYFAPGSSPRRVTHPDAAPRRHVTAIATPSLSP